MTRKDGFEKFSLDNIKIDKAFAEKSIIATFNTLWWELFASNLARTGLDTKNLKTIEVGCGSGAKSLIIAMLGADVTLLDIDDDALKAAKEMFALYDCKAAFVKANVMDEPPQELIGRFDYVSSGGLIEHFTGDDRSKVMAYHQKLLKENGFAMISVPNSLSLLYWAQRALSTLFGVWDIETEIPFTRWELKKTGEKAGFTQASVLGIARLGKDVVVYGFAIIALMLKIIPEKLRSKIKKWGMYSRFKKVEINTDLAGTDMADFVKTKLKDLAQKKETSKKTPKDYTASGLIFFGRK